MQVGSSISLPCGIISAAVEVEPIAPDIDRPLEIALLIVDAVLFYLSATVFRMQRDTQSK